MTTDDLDRLRVLAGAATPGPWDQLGIRRWRIYAGDVLVAVANGATHSDGEVNGDYIAAMHPETTKALLDRLDRQSALCAAMAQWLSNQQHWTDLPDDHVVLESRATDGSAEYRITAGMIRAANGGCGS